MCVFKYALINRELVDRTIDFPSNYFNQVFLTRI